MIPKIVHYCWFGGKPLPELALKCIDSWKKFCPDYQIVEWNESNFDFNTCPYVKEAAANRKWAFVSDYVRFYVLYRYGGVYFDTDVELIASIDDIVEKGAFMACEQSSKGSPSVATGLGMGVEKSSPIVGEIIQDYNHDVFIADKPVTVVARVTKILENHGYEESVHTQSVCGINIYPWDYFCPLNFFTGEMVITNNTRSIHHYNMSWQSPFRVFLKQYQIRCVKRLGKRIGNGVFVVSSIPMRFIHKAYTVFKKQK